MNIRRPERAKALREADALSRLSQEALDDAITLEGLAFSGETLEFVRGDALEYAQCAFTRCLFEPGEVKRHAFTDVTFDHCDFSNMRFSESTFRRCEFVACRMTGADLPGSCMGDVTLTDCAMRYVNANGGKWTNVRLKDCELRQAAMGEMKLKNVAFEGCSLAESEWNRTPLKGIDLRTCALDGVSAGGYELTGAVVSPEQAVELIRVFGVVVKP